MNENIVDIMDKWMANRLDSVHTILPGKFLDYYGHLNRKAKVKPLVKIRNVHNKLVEIDPIDNVPVLFPSTADFNLLFKISNGDGCLLLFSECSIGNFLNSSGNVVDADNKNRFDLTDCIAIPGLWSYNTAPSLEDAEDDDFNLLFQDAKINISNETNEITIEDGSGNKIECKTTGIIITDANNNIITLNSSGLKYETPGGNNIISTAGNFTMLSGTEPFVKGNVLNTWLTSVLISIFNAHTHPGVMPGAASTGTPAAPLTPPVSLLSSNILGK